MRILLFIGLKLAEILAIVFMPYWLGRLICKIPYIGEAGIPYWIAGFLGIIMLFAVLMITFCTITEVLPIICRANWNWAGRILRK